MTVTKAMAINAVSIFLGLASTAKAAVNVNYSIHCLVEAPGIHTDGRASDESQDVQDLYGNTGVSGFSYVQDGFQNGVAISHDDELGDQLPFFARAQTEASPGIRLTVRPAVPLRIHTSGQDIVERLFSEHELGPWKNVYVSFFPSRVIRHEFLNSCTAAEGINCAFNKALYGQVSVEFPMEDVLDGKAQSTTSVAVVGSNHQLSFVRANVQCAFER